MLKPNSQWDDALRCEAFGSDWVDVTRRLGPGVIRAYGCNPHARD